LQFLADFGKFEPFISMTKLHTNLALLLGPTYHNFEFVEPLKPDPNFDITKATRAGAMLRLLDALSSAKVKENWFDNVMLWLDMLFQECFGWPKGKVQTMSIEQMSTALEWAMDNPSPGRPTVWELTSDARIKSKS
jgi:hypothetical protein